jgi:hypothetical protein
MMAVQVWSEPASIKPKPSKTQRLAIRKASAGRSENLRVVVKEAASWVTKVSGDFMDVLP